MVELTHWRIIYLKTTAKLKIAAHCGGAHFVMKLSNGRKNNLTLNVETVFLNINRFLFIFFTLNHLEVNMNVIAKQSSC